MANHASGDKSGEVAQPVQMGPVEPITSSQNDWRKAYASNDRLVVTSKDQSKASFGFADDLFVPPVEFAGFMGYGGYGGYANTLDPFSNPARYGYAGYGFQGKEGWAYGRGHNNIDHQRIAQCRLLYKTEGLVQAIVHLLADFVVENIDLVHPDETVHNFYQAWQTQVKLKDRLHRFVIDLLTTGNVFVWTKIAKLKDIDKQNMKKGLAAQLIGGELVVTLTDADGKRLRDKTISVEMKDDIFSALKELNEACHKEANDGRVSELVVNQAEGATRNDPEDPRLKNKTGVEIPWGYISLNPLQMEPRGSRFANEHYWVMLLQQRDLRPLSKFMNYRHYTDIGTTQVNLPEIFKGKISPLQGNTKRSGYSAELRLDEDRLAVIQDITKTDYEEWATPQIYPAYKEIVFKRMLRQGEISAMESLKHMVTLIKLGNVQEGFIPTQEQLERVATALAGGSQTHHLIWDNLIEGDVLQPNLGNIFDPKKYQQVDKDIYAAMGIPESVMTGKGNFANSFISIKLLLEKLETIRCKLEDWLRVEVKHIADVMKFRRLPIIDWGMVDLRDENAERKLWLELYDRGIVSDESILERFGTTFDVEKSRQDLEAKEKEARNKDITKEDKQFRVPVMVSKGPFNREPLGKTPQPKPQQPEGRPIKTGTTQQTRRSTKPKGMSSVIEFQNHYNFAKASIKLINDQITNLVVESENLKDSRSLTKAQKSNIETRVIRAMSALEPSVELNSDLVYKLMDDSPIDQKILDIYNQESSNVASKEDRFELMCNTYAAIKASLLEDHDGETS